MSKVTDARITAIKNRFPNGARTDEDDFADLIDAIQEAAQAHQHLSTGGDGMGTGDAGPVINLQSGTAAQKPGSPAVGDVYVETDTSKVFACFSAGSWTDVTGGPGVEAPADASYVTTQAEEGLSAETLHSELTGATLHNPKAHAASHASGDDKLKYTRQAILYIPGTLEVGTNQSAEITYRGPTATIVRADAHVKTEPTGQAAIFDININGTSIWNSTPANRVQIAAGADNGTQTSFDTTTISDGDVLTIDTDQIGSGDEGETATVELEMECNPETG
jgi:hypothetical protein